jgi:GAF domain-containing protein
MGNSFPCTGYIFTEMARIAEAFNKILSELKANTSELESLVYKLSTLSEVTELVSRIPDIKEVLQVVLQRAMTAVHAKIGSIMLLDPQTQTLRIAAAEGLEDTVVVGTIIRVGEGIAGKVAQTGEPILVEDVEHDERFSKVNDPKYDTSSCICLPLRAQDHIIGVLNLSKKSGQNPVSRIPLNRALFPCAAYFQCDHQRAVAQNNANDHRRLTPWSGICP